MNWIQGISADMITSSKAYAHRIAQLSSCFAYYIHLLFTASSAYNKQFYVCAVLFENIPILYDLFTLVWTNNRFHQADWKFICFLEWKKSRSSSDAVRLVSVQRIAQCHPRISVYRLCGSAQTAGAECLWWVVRRKICRFYFRAEILYVWDSSNELSFVHLNAAISIQLLAYESKILIE